MTEEQIKRVDHLLADTRDGEYWFVWEEDPQDRYPIVSIALRYKLVVPDGDTYELTQNGYDALAAGGFEQWLLAREQGKRPSNTITIGGSVSGSQIGQDSSFRDLTPISKATASPSKKENQHKIRVSNVVKVVISILVGVLIGVIVLYIEHKTGWFSNK